MGISRAFGRVDRQPAIAYRRDIQRIVGFGQLTLLQRNILRLRHRIGHTQIRAARHKSLETFAFRAKTDSVHIGNIMRNRGQAPFQRHLCRKRNGKIGLHLSSSLKPDHPPRGGVCALCATGLASGLRADKRPRNQPRASLRR